MSEALEPLFYVMRMFGPYTQILEIVAYGLLSVVAARIAWSTPMGVIGVTLPLCCAITNAAYFSHDFGTRVLFEVFQVILLSQTARLAFAAYPRWPTIGVVWLSVADLAWCAVQPLMQGPQRGFWFGTVSNVVFVLTCFCVIAPRLIYARRDSFPLRDPRGMVDDYAPALDAISKKVTRL